MSKISKTSKISNISKISEMSEKSEMSKKLHKVQKHCHSCTVGGIFSNSLTPRTNKHFNNLNNN